MIITPCSLDPSYVKKKNMITRVIICIFQNIIIVCYLSLISPVCHSYFAGIPQRAHGAKAGCLKKPASTASSCGARSTTPKDAPRQCSKGTRESFCNQEVDREALTEIKLKTAP
jgi:hypothetical protein